MHYYLRPKDSQPRKYRKSNGGCCLPAAHRLLCTLCWLSYVIQECLPSDGAARNGLGHPASVSRMSIGPSDLGTPPQVTLDSVKTDS